ncbi:hypothetical protein BO85DRAFT_459349 [Aspergillus piperis CBS 112811]|uniref:Major facilitator superfamily (MFS) profile domain-containing protein n=1 Tax=Aspergillus piperis CBS 112811 TaxID=1448313 RepID=A0A8G1VLV3_9EURO|nr:hypothetical protein BO85DRAFT_459349 [Aspergillus piperis CBS 112811]RAH58189.1 hypothetical protein BO85DRAFT_459349 [Aspergillus piperis CBS 112811]
MSLFTFLISVISAIMAPALDKVQQELHFPSSTTGVISLSVYLLGVAIVPLFTAPLSEISSRMIILRATDVLFIVFNTLCGTARTPNQLIGLCFLAGLGGAGAKTTKLYHGFTDYYRNIGAAIYGAGALHEIQCIVGYIMDTYPKYASSAVAAVMFLGLGWGNTLLALIAVVVGIPAPILLRWRYGDGVHMRRMISFWKNYSDLEVSECY